MIEIVQFEYRYGGNQKAKKPDDHHDENGLFKFAFQSQRPNDGQIAIDCDVRQNEDAELGGEGAEEAGELAETRRSPV